MLKINERYKLIGLIGQGGMGEVYRAHDRLTGQVVAVKRVLINPSQLAYNSKPATADEKNFVASLTREFEILATMRHPHIISVLDYGFDSYHQPYFTMEFIENPTSVMNFGFEIDHASKISLCLQMLEGISYLHRRGLLHRDLKPDNILVLDQRVKIIDFGLAVVPNKDVKIGGTLTHIAPEILSGEVASQESDLWSLGLVFYGLFTRRYPFNNQGSVVQLIQEICTLEPNWSGIPDFILPIIQKLLEKSPDNRYLSASHVIQDIYKHTGIEESTDTKLARESIIQSATFAGREKELAQLTSAWQASKNSQGSILLVGAESGMGKSRLVNELRIQALIDGGTVLRGYSTETSNQAFEMWREPLRHLVLKTKLTDFQIAVLKDLMPDIETLLNRSVSAIPKLKGEAMKARLLRAIIQVLQQQTTPTLIILEDLQWSATLSALRLISDDLQRLPLMLIGTYRIDESPEIPETLQKAEVIEIQSLKLHHIESLTASILDSPAWDPSIFEDIQSQSYGNTFFVLEFVRAIAEEADSLYNIDIHQLSVEILREGTLSIIERRINRVPHWAQKMLKLAALVGQQIVPDLLEKAIEQLSMDMSQHSIDEWLTICTNNSVLTVTDEVWTFTHDKYREAILATIEQENDNLLYANVAELIENFYTPDLEIHYAELVNLYHKADVPLKERHYCILAGQHFLQQFIMDRALACFERALELTGDTDLHDRFEILAERGRAYHWLIMREDQYNNILLLSEITDSVNDPSLKARVAVWWAEYYEHVDEFIKTREWAQQAIDLAQHESLIGEKAKAHFWMARAYRRERNYSEALDHSLNCLEFSREAEDILLEINALRHIGMVYMYQTIFDLAADYFEQSIELAEQIDHRQAQVMGIMARSELYTNQSYFEKSVLEALIAYEVSLVARDRVLQVWSVTVIVFNYIGLGKYNTAQTYAEKLVELEAATQSQSFLDYGYYTMSLCNHLLGNKEKTQYYVGLALKNHKGNQRVMLMTSSMIASVIYEDGEFDIAYQMLEETLQLMLDANSMDKIYVYLLMAIIDIDLGRYDAADMNTQHAFTEFAEFGRGIFPFLETILWGRLQSLLENWDEAQRAFDDLLGAFEEGQLSGIQFPIRYFLYFYKVGVTLDDARCVEALEIGYNYLLRMLDDIPQPQDKEKFIAAFAHRQEFMRLYQLHLTDE